MEANLSAISSQIEKYINMIKALFNVDVDICDQNLIRVAGTGVNDKMIGKRLASGRHSQKAMEERTYVIAKDPLNEELCQGCVNQNVCLSHCGMTFPLVYDEEVFGAINITALDSAQEQELIERQDDFVLFMKSICDLITLTMREYHSYMIQAYNAKLQERLINVISDGVMILNENNNVEFMNERCAKILGYNLRQVQYLTKIRQFSVKPAKHNVGEQKECRVIIRDTVIKLVGKFYEIDNDRTGKSNKIFVFYDMKTLYEDMTPVPASKPYTFGTLTGKSPVFNDMIAKCESVAYTLSPVLLIGETGTGKEMVARAIHNESTLRNNRFIELLHSNAIQELLEKSVFYDTEESRKEYPLKMDLLEGNTLYVNEISNLNMENQQVLLRVINRLRLHNSRVICSTSKELKPLTESGVLDPELFYALDVNSISIPAMRFRGNDIKLFADEALSIANKHTHKNIRFSKEIYDLFLRYPWPGNIREIENTVTYIVSSVDVDEGTLEKEQLSEGIMKKLDENHNVDYNLKNAERELIIKALNELAYDTNSKKLVAKELGISLATLYRKLEAYGIKENLMFQ